MLDDRGQLAAWLGDHLQPAELQSALANASQLRTAWSSESHVSRKTILGRLFARIVLQPSWIRFEIDHDGLTAWLADRPMAGNESQPSETGTEPLVVEHPVAIRRRGIETRLILTNGAAPYSQPDPSLIDLLARAHAYLASLTSQSGRGLSEVAVEHDTSLSEVSWLLPLAFLAPDIVDAICKGKQPAELTAQRLSRLADVPLAWHGQAEHLGL